MSTAPKLEEANRAIREAVAARLAATPPEPADPAGGLAPAVPASPMAAALAGCPPAAAAAAACLSPPAPPAAALAVACSIPNAVIEQFPPRIEHDPSDLRAKWRQEAERQGSPVVISAEKLDELQQEWRNEREENLRRWRAAVGGQGPPVVISGPANADDRAAAALARRLQAPRIVGIAGPIGAGKTIAASMVPGAWCLQWADPIYRAIAAALDVPEEILRDRTNKESGLEVAGLLVIARHMLRTLGTEWGRDCVHPDLWVRLGMARVDRIAALTRRSVFAFCGTRFPNEVAAIRERDGEVWWIERPGHEPPAGPAHRSEGAIGPQDCHRILRNGGTPDDLRRIVADAFGDFEADRAERIADAVRREQASPG